MHLEDTSPKPPAHPNNTSEVRRAVVDDTGEMAALVDALVDTHFEKKDQKREIKRRLPLYVVPDSDDDDDSQDGESAAQHGSHQHVSPAKTAKNSSHIPATVSQVERPPATPQFHHTYDTGTVSSNSPRQTPVFTREATLHQQKNYPVSLTPALDTSMALRLDIPFHRLQIQDNPPSYSANPVTSQGSSRSVPVLGWAPAFNYKARFFYVVSSGRRCGIYSDWNYVSLLVRGVSNNCHKRYRRLSEARKAYYDLKERGLVAVHRDTDEEVEFGPIATAFDEP